VTASNAAHGGIDAVGALADQVRRGELTAVELAEKTLSSISEKDGALGAFLTRADERLLAQARAIDEKRARGALLGPLAGIPVAIKDAISTRGVRTTAGSKILESYVPPFDATVVERLALADALLPGKTNMDEFAMGSSTEHSAFHPTKNPHDTTRSPGGSSGGSAVAVAAGMTPAALGSDTGGSIRQPAAFAGVVGLKPSYGRVSRFGLIAFASSLDQVGPFAADVRGAARVLRVIAGRDPRDATSRDAPVPDYLAACGESVRGLRIGIPDEYFETGGPEKGASAGPISQQSGLGLDPEVEANVRAAIVRLERDGCTIRRISLPHTRYAVATYYVIATAEASANLARFDGVRYGLRKDAPSLIETIGRTRDAGFGAEVKRRILLGTFVLSAGYYDAYYLKAQKVRTLLVRDFDAAFSEVDAIVSPTSPTPAFRLGEKTGDPLAMYLNDVYTLPASLAGIAGLSVPVEKTRAGLPVGLQILTPSFREDVALRVGAAVEAALR
jgi:aspartyl-tRNA(Asn)/glutamyl-tRNA(Gln) amidotransferase subunit A